MANRSRGEGARVYRRLLGYALRQWQRMAVAVGGMAVFAATDTGFAALMKPLMDGSFVERDPQTIRWIPLALLAVLVVRGLGAFCSAYYMAYVGRTVVKRLRTDLFDQLLHLPVAYFDRSSTGQLIAKLTYNVDQVADAATKSLTVLIRDTLTILGLLAWMFYLSWMLALAFVLIAPPIAALVVYVTKRFRRLSRKIQSSRGDLTHVTEEVIQGHRVVKLFGGQRQETDNFERVNAHYWRMQMKLVATNAASTPFIQFIVGLALAGIVFLATVGPVLEAITAGTFVSFMISMILLLGPARNLTSVNAQLQRGIAAGESIFELLDSEREHDRPAAPPPACRGEVVFEDVHFSYDPAKGPVLEGVSLAAAPGETVALVGRSGSGKSTLANLLPRFYELERGAVRIDGVNVRDYSLQALRARITYVSQEVVLFNDTVANNIAYGRQSDTARAKIRAAAEAAHAMEFIERLPQGLDTTVGEHGVLLSGGQRQRLAIARALLKDAPILVLDEATSSLDSESERHIYAALEALIKDRTTLVIAHRLSTVESADRIVVLQDGRVAESGRHGELLARGGLYAELYRLQLRETDQDEARIVEPIGARRA